MVAHHSRPVVVLFHKSSHQVLEGGDLGEEDSVDSDLPILPLPCFLLHQAMPLPLHSPYAEFYFQVPAVKGLLWHKHVAPRAPVNHFIASLIFSFEASKELAGESFLVFIKD